MSDFILPDAPASADLYNLVIDASLDYQDGARSEEAYRLIVQRYEESERLHFEAAWLRAA